MQADSSTGEFFANNRDVLDAILLKLTGAQAARVAATCRAFRDALAPAAALWAEYYASEFGDADFSFAASVTWARRFQTAYRRLQLCAARWNRGRAGEDDAGPGARQGAASCAFTLAAFGGCFAVYGGWTDMHGISRDLHVLRRRESAASDSNYYWTPCMIAVTARPGPAPRQVYSGPSRATYGVTVSAAQSVGGSDGPGAQVERVKLLVLGGVTSGGYRGATGALHTIELRSTLVEHVLTGAQAARLSAEWTEESSVGGRPRAYHSATYAGGTAHASNQHKLWVFGGHNDETDGGCVAAFEAYDVATRTWDPVPLGPHPEPCARLGHSGTAVGGRLFISGGCTDSSNMKPNEGGEELSDVWLLDLRRPSAELAWACVSLPYQAPPGALQRCHAAAPLGTNILFFGGGRSSSLTNALSVFDTASSTWHDGPTTLAGRAPTARQNAQCAIVPGSGVLVIFGGWRPGPMGQDRNLGDTILLDLDHQPSAAEVRPSSDQPSSAATMPVGALLLGLPRRPATTLWALLRLLCPWLFSVARAPDARQPAPAPGCAISPAPLGCLSPLIVSNPPCMPHTFSGSGGGGGGGW